ncbi:uncharacterized protein LOC114264245 [Camellia sinensis]|uniref:uncharacterized protein LOC114264245 n=1 Tax=Camellia sinensis TaxID=4442 RepID=UPI00103639DC|nr:uncharacterized protein LOC114264245 [Camellia sinensis]
MPWGTYCYRVMPFRLKNAEATYQWAATTILHDMIHKKVEMHVDDMIVKSKERRGHYTALEKFFEWIKEYRLRLNPQKSTFGKGKKFQWNDQCQFTFEQVKQYLQNPPVLSPPEPGKPLILYLSVTNSTMGWMLVQESEVKVKEEKMKVYHQALDVLISRFKKLTFTHLLIDNNRFADALATLSSMVDIPLGVKMCPIIIEQKYAPAYETIIMIDEVQDTNPLYYDIWSFLDKEAYPPGWVETQSYAVLKASHVAKYIKNNIICQYKVPNKITSDNDSHFKKEVIDLLEKYNVAFRKSSTYRPQTNGAVEATDKNIKRIVQKMVKICKDWLEKLPFALWGYRTSIRTSTGATPYSLVHGMEVILPIEIEVPSLRIMVKCQIAEVD